MDGGLDLIVAERLQRADNFSSFYTFFLFLFWLIKQLLNRSLLSMKKHSTNYKREFDILVIGGGILVAVSHGFLPRGMKVALIEKNDFIRNL